MHARRKEFDRSRRISAPAPRTHASAARRRAAGSDSGA